MAATKVAYANKQFQSYEEYAEWQACLDYAQDQERYVPLFTDKRVPCSNPDCGALCRASYCSETCEAADNAAIAHMAQLLEAQMLQLGCQRTRYYADQETSRVLLGLKARADEQYAQDEAAGGLVALACGRR
jgi:hypothetical protein